MIQLKNTNCCGVGELYNLSRMTPKNVIINFERKVYSRGGDDGWRMPTVKAHYMFHDVENKNGDKLAEYITKYDLGGLLATESRKNPNSPRKVKAWLFTPSKTAIQRHIKSFTASADKKKALAVIKKAQEDIKALDAILVLAKEDRKKVAKKKAQVKKKVADKVAVVREVIAQ